MDRMNPSEIATESKTKTHPSYSNKEEEQKELVFVDLFHNLLPKLPKTPWIGCDLYLYEGFWYPVRGVESMLYCQHDFKPYGTDIILASAPKSGTTWLKSMAFTIVNRHRHSSFKDHPLLTTSPHQLVPFVDYELKQYFHDHHPRLFASHSSYSSLPTSIKASSDHENKIVYICRNPFDTFISMYHFDHQILNGDKANHQVPIQEIFDKFCQGIHGAGPFWDHMLEYWKASLERPEKVLFLKYEDVKEDNVMYIKKLACFLGLPFSEEEEKQGLIQEISSFCSFERMKDFEANNTAAGKAPDGVANSAFFRKGKVGDSIHYLTPSMVERMEQLMEEKFGGSGLSFKMPAGKIQMK